MDPCFVKGNAAVLHQTQFAYTDETTRRRMNNAATPKPGIFDEEWAKLDLVPMVMRDKVDLQEASLIVMSVKPELAISGKLLTRTALAPFGCEEIKIMHGEEEDQSAGRLVVTKFPDGTMSERECPWSSGRNQKRDDKEGEDRRSEEPMQQDLDQAGKEDNKASAGGMSSLDFNFPDDFKIGTETIEGTTEPAEDETSTQETPSTFMEINRNLLESSSPGNSKTTEKKILMESPRSRKIESQITILGNVT